MNQPALNTIVRDNRKISNQIEYQATQALAPGDFTAVQAYILLCILEHPEGTSLTDIRQAIGGSLSALSCLVKRLKAKGYVRVEHWPGDDRRKLLFATEKGIAAKEYLDQSMEHSLCRIFDGISDQELENLDHIHKKIIENPSKCSIAEDSSKCSQLNHQEVLK